MKNLVADWARGFGYAVNDVTKQQPQDAPIDWALEMKNIANVAIIVFATKNSDVLRFQSQINFSPEHRQKTGTLPNEEYNEFVLDMTDRLSYLGCDWQFMHDTHNPRQMNGLGIVYVTTFDGANKNTVLQLITRSFVTMSQMIRAISITLNKGGDPQGTSIQSTDKSIYG